MSSMVEVAVRKANTTRSPILSLVDREYLKSTANIKTAAWEPLAYLYSEADQAKVRINSMNVPEDLEWARRAAISSWNQVLGWLDELLLQSQSIEALRSWQMVRGLENGGHSGGRPSGTIIPDFQEPQPPGTEQPKKSMLKGRR